MARRGNDRPDNDRSGNDSPWDESTGQVFRRRQWRRFAIAVSLPGLVLGTGTIAAFSSGLIEIPGGDGPCAPTIVPAPPRDSFKVAVQNSNETAGQGGAVARELTKRGFVVSEVTNAPAGVYIKRAAMVYHGREGADAALLVAAQIPGSRTWFDGRGGDGVELVIGYGFDGMTRVPPAPPPIPSEIDVNVYNTTYREGLAGDVADDLAARGFGVAEVGNDPSAAFLPDDTAVLRFGPDGAEAAKALAEHVPGARMQQDDRATKAVDLTLGNGYSGLRDAALVPQPAPRPAPVVETIARPCVS